MRTEQLLLSGLDITEDNYSFKGQFILSGAGKSKHVDVEDLEHHSFLADLKKYFELEEHITDIRNILMEMIVEKAHISSKIVEGENY
jgi:hypothetical protein